MKKIITLIMAIGMMAGAMAQKTIYDFTVKDQNGKEVSLEQYRGKVILVVNTATQCGFTEQYARLEKYYKKMKDDGFVILDFPCNQFGAQAPGSNEEIHAFCTSHYNVTFPQFDKIDVNGPDASPLFVWLKSQKGFEGFDLDNPIGKRLDQAFRKQDPDYDKNPDIKWNFTKFLIDREGNVVMRIEPTSDIDSLSGLIDNELHKTK